MKCPNCNNEIAAGTRFCGTCGTAIPEGLTNEVAFEENPVIKKNFTVKILCMVGVFTVIAIIAFIVCVKLFTPSNYNYSSSDSFYLYMTEEEKVKIAYSNGATQDFDGEFGKISNRIDKNNKSY